MATEPQQDPISAKSGKRKRSSSKIKLVNLDSDLKINQARELFNELGSVLTEQRTIVF